MIPFAKPYFFGNEEKFVVDALHSTWISGGPYVDKLESKLSEIMGSKHAITTSNGTTALTLALLSIGIGQGDEVIIPDFTFVAPGNTTLLIGANPIYVDVNKDTWCIEPELIKKAITPKTKAIIVVHIYGNVCDMDEIIQIAKENHLYVIEDVAEAAFSKYKGRYAGTFGDIGCFSFQATKTITTGEGGAVLTDNQVLAEKMRKIKNHGMTSKKYWHDVKGYNYRLTNLQAAFGCAQLENIDLILNNKKRIYETYLKNLKNVEEVIFQTISREVEPILWAVAIKINPLMFKGNRNFLIEKLLKKGIETRPGFYPFSVMPPYNSTKCLIAEDISKNIIVLPSFLSLKEEEIKKICETIKEALDET